MAAIQNRCWRHFHNVVFVQGFYQQTWFSCNTAIAGWRLHVCGHMGKLHSLKAGASKRKATQITADADSAVLASCQLQEDILERKERNICKLSFGKAV
eukprot:6478666-Amphidinium_carterae.2